NLLVRGGTITGPTSGTFTIDNGSAQPIAIGTTTATTINIGQSGQAQNLLGNATVSGTLGVTGNFSVNTNKFNVTAASGNTTVAGTLGVTSDLTVNTNKFIVTALTGNTTVGGTLSVLGATITGPTSGTFGIDGGFANGALNIGTTANTGTVTIGRSGPGPHFERRRQCADVPGRGGHGVERGRAHDRRYELHPERGHARDPHRVRGRRRWWRRCAGQRHAERLGCRRRRLGRLLRGV